MKNKALNGLIASPYYKRFNSFLNTVADREKVCLLYSDDTVLTYGFLESAIIPVWSNEDFCKSMCGTNERPVSVEIHSFIEWISSLNERTFFAISPNQDDFVCISGEKLISELLIHLSEVE